MKSITLDSDELCLGAMVIWECGGLYSGDVIAFDDRLVACCNVELVKEGGNDPQRRPVLFVDRRDVRVVKGRKGVEDVLATSERLARERIRSLTNS